MLHVVYNICCWKWSCQVVVRNSPVIVEERVVVRERRPRVIIWCHLMIIIFIFTLWNWILSLLIWHILLFLTKTKTKICWNSCWVIFRLEWELAWQWRQEWLLEPSWRRKCFTTTAMAGIMDITGDETTTEDTDREKVFTMETRLHGTNDSLPWQAPWTSPGTSLSSPSQDIGHCGRYYHYVGRHVYIVNSNLIIGWKWSLWEINGTNWAFFYEDIASTGFYAKVTASASFRVSRLFLENNTKLSKLRLALRGLIVPWTCPHPIWRTDVCKSQR